MAAKELREFFRTKKAKAAPGNIDWAGRKKAWVDAIERLYRRITQDYLSGLQKDGLVRISYTPKTIHEDYIGEYEVRELVLHVGGEKVVFSPKGTNIVGASGRIDLRGDMGEVTIVLQPRVRWCVVLTRTPTLKTVPLDEESLLMALKSVMQQ